MLTSRLAIVLLSVKSLLSFPSFKEDITSLTSIKLPILFPSGWFISETTAQAKTLFFFKIFTINLASFFASTKLSINAPSPYFTSKTITLAPLASFLLTIEEAISGKLATVFVLSLRAYIFLSAGTRSSV